MRHLAGWLRSEWDRVLGFSVEFYPGPDEPYEDLWTTGPLSDHELSPERAFDLARAEAEFHQLALPF